MHNPAYPLELFQRVITVSLETMKIVRNLPPLDIRDNSRGHIKFEFWVIRHCFRFRFGLLASAASGNLLPPPRSRLPEANGRPLLRYMNYFVGHWVSASFV